MNILCSDKVEVIQLKAGRERSRGSRIGSLTVVVGESQRILLKTEKN